MSEDKNADSVNAEDLTEDQAQQIWDDIDLDAPARDRDAADTGAEAKPEGEEKETASDEDNLSGADSDSAKGDQEPPSEESRAKSNDRDDEGTSDDFDMSTLPEAARKHFESLKTSHETELKRARGTTAGQSRKIHDLERQLAALNEKLSEKEKSTPSGDDASFNDDYPEISEALKRETAPIRAEMEKLASERDAEKQKVLEENFERFEAAMPSPDFLKENLDDWHDWLENHATHRDFTTYEKNIKSVVDPDGAISVVKKFKKYLDAAKGGNETGDPNPDDNSKETRRRQAQIQSAKSTSRTGTSASAAAKSADDMSDEEYWDAIDV